MNRKHCDWLTTASSHKPSTRTDLSKHLRHLPANPHGQQRQTLRSTGSSEQLGSDKRGNKVEADVWPQRGRQRVVFGGIHSACLLLGPSKPRGSQVSILSPLPAPPLSFLCCPPSSRYESALGSREGITDGAETSILPFSPS